MRPVNYPSDFRTPAFVVDAVRVRANAEDMSRRAERRGIRLRPHVKTHKTAEIAKIQVEDQFGGITVSTMAEAAFFAEAGFGDILYAFPVTPDKLPQALELAAKITFAVVTDHGEGVDAIVAATADAKRPLGVFLAIDSGTGREGVVPGHPDIEEWARKLHGAAGVDFRGVMTHAGHTYTAAYEEGLEIIAADEAKTLRELAARIEAAGVPCPERSLGSTPGAKVDHGPEVYEGVTEMRPGNYIFYDRFMCESGHCQPDEVACFVATRIASVYADRKTLLIDAGALALSKDLGPVHLSAYKGGFGTIEDHPELKITKLSQEHGLVATEQEDVDFSQFHVGQILHVIPNHSCLTAAMFDKYHWLEADWITKEIHPVRGW